MPSLWVSVATLPVQSDDLDILFHHAEHQHEGQVGFAGSASASDEDVCSQPRALQHEWVQLAVTVGDVADGNIASPGELL